MTENLLKEFFFISATLDAEESADYSTLFDVGGIAGKKAFKIMI